MSRGNLCGARPFTRGEVIAMHALSLRGLADSEIARRFKVQHGRVAHVLARVMPNGRIAPHMHGDFDYATRATCGRGHPCREAYAAPDRGEP